MQCAGTKAILGLHFAIFRVTEFVLPLLFYFGNFVEFASAN